MPGSHTPQTVDGDDFDGIVITPAQLAECRQLHADNRRLRQAVRACLAHLQRQPRLALADRRVVQRLRRTLTPARRRGR